MLKKLPCNSILYNNNTKNENSNHIKFIFNGEGFNVYGVGAKVTIWSDGKSFYKENFLNKGFMSSRSSGIVFGLGDSNLIDSIQVLWPSKKNQTLYDVATNQTIKLNENEATQKNQKSKLNSQTVFSDVSSESESVSACPSGFS